LHPVERIGPKASGEVVPLTGPLAILSRCDDRVRQIPGSPWATLTSLLRFYHKDCRRFTFFRMTYKEYRKMRRDYNFFDHPAPVSCQLCQIPITSSKQLIEHLFSQMHKQKVVELGTSVDKRAFLYWSDSINSSFDGSRCHCEDKMGQSDGFPVVVTEEPQEEVKINRDLVPLVGPLAILARCDDPSKKLKEDSIVALERLHKYTTCNLKKLLASHNHIFTKVRYNEFNHTAIVVCGLCKHDIYSSLHLLKHVSSSIHLNKIQQLGTSVDEEAYWYWNNIIHQCLHPPSDLVPVDIPQISPIPIDARCRHSIDADSPHSAYRNQWRGYCNDHNRILSH
ncbi:hypothetical protein PENTCL1PPCAC_8053, partial [Pristionchus entomophagus]